MSSDTLIQEVDEELRRDRIRKLWRQLAPFIIGGAVLIVLGVAGYQGWTWWQKTQAAKSSDQFYAATKIADGTDFTAAKKALDDVIAQTSGGYPMLGQFREAALLSQQGKTDDAVAAYDVLSSSLDNTHLRELALILAGNALIDKGDVSAVQQRVGGSVTPADPLRNAAREVLGLTQYKAGKLDDAMKSFSDIINDPLSTQDTRSRVQLYVEQLEAEGAKPIAPPTDQTTAPPSSSEPAAPVSSTAPAVSSEAPGASSAASASSSAAPVASSAAPVASSAAPSASSAALSASASTVTESSPVDMTPPAIVVPSTAIDTSMLQMIAPQESSAGASVSTPASVSEPASSASAPVASSALPPSSSAP